MKLTPENVHDLANSALYTTEEISGEKSPEGAVIVKGLVHNFGFHPERLEQTRENVKDMLAQLPDEFKEGWSFLNMCVDRNGDLWTGDHATMELLVVLAIGLELASYCAPREFWSVLPGGVPYIAIKEQA
jgi:hypothetical protein